MRSQKVLNGLNATPSQIKRNLKYMKPTGYNMDIDEMLMQASMKLRPIIDVLMAKPNAPDHFISIKDCDDIEQVSRIVKDAAKSLENIGFLIDIKPVALNMQKYRRRANTDGSIYVDTTLLVGILELHRVLEGIKEDLEAFYKSIGIHSFAQTESGLDSLPTTAETTESSYNSNKIVFKLKRPATRGGSFALLKNEFILMPSTTEIPLNTSQSQVLAQDGSSTSPRRSRSDISFDNERITGVTDAYGARHLLVKCIYDLKGVSEYLGTPRRDAYTIYTMDLDEDHEDEDEGGPSDEEEPQARMSSLKETSSNTEPVNISSPTSSQASVEKRSETSPTSIKSIQQEQRKSTPKTSLISPPAPVQQVERIDQVPVGTPQKCCCPECFAEARRADETLGECDEDAVIICIKGCHEDEGDIQIVIRQCPDCKASTAAQKDQPIKPPSLPPPAAPAEPTSTPPAQLEETVAPPPPRKSSLEPVPSQPSAESVTSALRRSVAESITSEPRKSSISQASKRRSTQQEMEVTTPPSETGSPRTSLTPAETTSPRTSVLPPASPRASMSPRESARQSILSSPRRSTPPDVPSSPRRSTPLVISTPPPQSATDFDESPGLNEEEKVDDIESVTLHNKDSQGSLVCSDDEEGEEGELTEKSLKKLLNYSQDRTNYSKIRLYETTNLCLETNTGEELMISLTVTPKDLSTGGPNPISLTDIFSDNDEVGRLQSDSRQRASSQPKKTINYYVPDKYIPLGRTKICSSLEFDVTTAESKIRTRGIKNQNNKILVQLQDFGTDNLLRACRPAKCCRKAVLNEKMKKCLPYAASIRSLPLDDDDMDVINQSLQMSLQKVKNSTNLQREFYANQVYLVNPVHTVQFCHLNSVVHIENVRKMLIEQKLKYYIELEQDLKIKKEWEVYYFEQVKSQNAKSTNGGVGDPAQEASRSSKWMKPCSGYTRRVSENHSSLVRTARKTGETENNHQRKIKSSKIPVYCGLKKLMNPRIDKSQHVHDLDNCYESPNNNNSRCSITTSVGETSLAKFDSSKLKLSVALQSFEESLTRYAQDHSSTSSIVIRRTKRKKKEFYLSRSRSEISLQNLQKLKRSKIISPVTRTTQVNKTSTSKEVVSVNTLPLWKAFTEDPEASKVVLGYFAKMLYDMIMNQMIREGPNLMDKGVETENRSLKELYKKPSKPRILNVNLPKFGVKISYHNLKAKQSQFCIVPSNQRNVENYYLINTMALQTSRILGDSKICQTSNTLLAYFFQPYIEQTRIFKTLYNLEGQSSSCDEIVSLNSRVSSHNVSESDPDDSLGRSLVKLKQTLEKYEHMKKQINKKSHKQSAINPIEYFVYHQACACSSSNNNHNHKPEKKQSFMQKILSKTKELFSSPEKDMCRKYKNQTEFLSMSPEEKDLCYNCGCSITQCASEMSPDTAELVEPLLCHCPEETKPKPKTSEPCCKKHKGICNFSKMTSNSSLLSLKTRLKRNNLKPHKHNGEHELPIEMCVDKQVQLVQCEKKSASTGTTKDSGTQKCECGKCENFAEDGTCCCSHCLGCLDKSFEVKPAHHTVGLVTEVRQISHVEKLSNKTASQTKSLSNKTPTITKSQSDKNSLMKEIYNEKSHSEAAVSTSVLMQPVPLSQPTADSNIETINTEPVEVVDPKPEQSATFFFVAPPPHMFQHLSGSNPFDQCRFNMPPFFHMERPPEQ